MNELITDLKALQDETLINLRSSKATNTIKAYRSDFKDFALFCIKNGLKSLPSEPKIVSLYLTYLTSKETKISTLKRRLVSIGVIHKIKGHYLDTKHPIIIENIMGISLIPIIEYLKPLIIQYSGFCNVINLHDSGSISTDQKTPPSIDNGIKTKVPNTPTESQVFAIIPTITVSVENNSQIFSKTIEHVPLSSGNEIPFKII